MARRQQQQEQQTPEDRADDVIRYNKRLQEAQQRDDLVAARVRFRNQALGAGIPSSWLPSVSDIKTMDDSTWNQHNQRINRLGFYGVDSMGRPIAKPGQASPVTGSPSPIRRTGGPLDDLSLGPFSTTAADARNIATRYAPSQPQTGPGSPAAVAQDHYYLGEGGKILGPLYDENGNKNPMPKGAVGLQGNLPPPAKTIAPAAAPASTSSSPLDAINNPPKIDAEPVPPASTAYLGVPSGQEVPPGAAVRAGQAARQFVESTRGPLSGLESYRPSYQPPGAEKPLVDIPAAINRGWQSVKNVASNVIGAVQGFGSGFVSGGGDKTAAGVSNSTAAQFEKPTKDSPVPVTPTTPVADIDKTTESLGRFGVSDDEFNRRKFAFDGF